MDVISIGEAMALFTPNEDGPLRYARNYSARIAGAETNTLIGLAKLGKKTGWISRLGKDEFGAMILSSVRGEGVDVSRVKIDADAPTGLFFKERANEAQVNVFYYRNGSAASFLEKGDIDEDYIKNAGFLYITGITPALSESASEAVFYAVKLARKHHKPVVFDPNVRKKLWEPERARQTILELVKQSDVVLPGLGEGRFLFGTDDEKDIAEAVHQLGSDIAVVKLGAKGAYYSSKNESGYERGYEIQRVRDPVGAGDGFAAGILSGLIEGIPLPEAVKRGCAVGAMVTLVNGDIEGLPDRDRLFAFMEQSEEDDVSR
ncbi:MULTISPECIES: sugar kinase [Bacillus]|uniref:sugar kinase n=1 Tax=Bacillus TaxID=1386 RepID=UPI0015819DEF|nr:sugar kinase [Bacillus glycinifermentans]MBU8788653.1 bifunctional hydroxymethylpyrimidine kinase/phosphomethylpyrimidine kinase [Bacillus glycinifermentans]NUJ17546.1 sugar kinase [Bacillus glycinifermentans]